MFNEPTNLNYKADLVQIGELAFIDPSLVSAMYCSSKTGAFVIRFAGMGYSEYFADDLFLSYSETAQAIFNEQKRSNSTSWPLDKKAVIESSEFYHRKKQETALSILEEVIEFAEDKAFCIDTADEQTQLRSLLEVAKDLIKKAEQEAEVTSANETGINSMFAVLSKAFSPLQRACKRSDMIVTIEGASGNGKDIFEQSVEGLLKLDKSLKFDKVHEQKHTHGYPATIYTIFQRKDK